jgi:hypothetical protein
MTYLSFGCQWLLVAVFGWSATTKLVGRGAFTAFRQATARLVPALRGHAAAAAVLVVCGELATAVALAIPATAVAGLVSALVLLTAFTVAVASALRRGSTASCNCFGRAAQPLSAHHLVRNAFLLAVAASGLLAAAGGQAGAAPAGLVLAGAVAVALAALVVNADAIVDLFSAPPETSRGDLERTTT